MYHKYDDIFISPENREQFITLLQEINPNIEKAFEYGIRAVIQPGGSKKDPDVIAMANKLGMVMLFTGKRHFRH